MNGGTLETKNVVAKNNTQLGGIKTKTINNNLIRDQNEKQQQIIIK